MERGEVGQEVTEGRWFFSVTAQPGWIKPVSNTIQLLLFFYHAQAGLSFEAPSACRKDTQDEVTEQIPAVQDAWSTGTFDTIDVHVLQLLARFFHLF